MASRYLSRFTGTILQTLVKAYEVNHDPQIAYQNARDDVKQQFNMTYLKPMAYQNNYAVAIGQRLLHAIIYVPFLI